jgi:glycerol uptake facilitator-like aquaporin
MLAKLAAEAVGTFWLVLGGCGSAVLAAAFPEVGIGLLGVSLAFGLTVVTGAYALGPISGGHFNPAVTVGLWAGGRFPGGSILPYVVAQVAGGIAGAGVLLVIASGAPGFDLGGGLASNGYAEHSPGKYSMVAGLVCEVVMTAMFLLVILGATHKRAPVGFAGLAHPPHQHPGDQHLGEPGAQHGAGALRGRLGAAATVAFLGGPADRRTGRRRAVPGALRSGERARHQRAPCDKLKLSIRRASTPAGCRRPPGCCPCRAARGRAAG